MPNENCTLKTSQAEAFAALFAPGQNICFQKRVNGPPVFMQYPFDASPEGCQLFCLNPFAADAQARHMENVEYRQGFTIEQDYCSLELQREWFRQILGTPTVANFSGNKSVHNHIMFDAPLTEEQADEMGDLLKKAFPFADWSVITDRAKLCRVPGALRDNGNEQSIEIVDSKKSWQTLYPLLKEYTERISQPPKDANNFFTDKKTKKTIQDALENLIRCGYLLTHESFEYRAMKDRPELAENLDDQIQSAKDALEALQNLAKEEKNKEPKDSWRRRASDAMKNRWQEFYAEHGIHDITPDRNGMSRGFTLAGVY